ncbi:trans-resveratrol di-o-methyltransferase [Phtheirospermum japonicum]|uniref:Trans-resveratrol di-o-methyltransferase n=1 Tax=Phtheirospermum japonicum TaxID=374723 RepID=A0A830B1J3_9LAMI|nr:trans-resveratrol di-o-methyltransferase [Phtheirospermum japonicum]
MLDPLLIDPWHDASEWFRNDCASPFMAHHGTTLWERLGNDESGNRLFKEGMASDARCVASVLTKECRRVFEGLRSMVDVGGGTGMLAKGIASAFPELECIVFDLPHVVDGMEGGKNLRYVSGDMWECVPHSDAVLLKWTLHDWDDQESVKLLEKCKEAIIPSKNKGGKLIIIEMVVDDEKEEREATETKLFFDMLMMVEVTGKERTEKEWANLFSAAGFSTYNISLGLGLRSVIEVFP